jgi:tetratricopeptide (TPR) repeat protein
VRDVAYDSLPKRDRAALHVNVAGWAETTLADRVDEFAELVAGHLAAALAYEQELAGSGAELRELREVTYRAAVRAARRAASVSALPATQRWQALAIEQARLLDAPVRDRIGLAIDYYAYLWHEPEPAERADIFAEAVELFDRLPVPTDDDRQVRARLQAALAEALLETNQLERAQAALREGIAALGTDPPSRGRADLQRVLGWTLWRTGSPGEATPILERAVADARAAGSDDALRWALHDLGIAMTQIGRMDDGLELMKESLEMARRAGDRALRGRCYINLPLTKSDRGDPWMEVVPMYEEGLQLARRDGAVATIAWLATNLSWELEDLGRIDERMDLATEALDAARRAGDDELVASAGECLAWGHLFRGEREQALREWATVSSVPRRPDGRGWYAILRAVLAWPDDAASAWRDLAGAFEDLSPEDQAYGAVARYLSRMALRLGERDGLVRATSAFLATTADRAGPVMVIRRRWFGGLATDPDGGEVEAAAEELERAGYRLLAVNAFADAALIAARAGRPSAAAERALAIAAEIGYHHLLGPLPETRWIAVSPAVTR